MEGPSYQDIQGKARGIQGDLSKLDAEELRLAKQTLADYLKTGITPIGDTQKILSELMAGQYADNQNQFDLTQAGVLSQINPSIRARINRHLVRRYNQQQASRPGQRWLDYAIQMGLI